MARKSHPTELWKMSDEELRAYVIELRGEPARLLEPNERLEEAETAAADRGLGLGWS